MIGVTKKRVKKRPEFELRLYLAYREREAAELLDCSQKWLQQDRYTGPTIPYVKLKGLIRYMGYDILEALKANRVV